MTSSILISLFGFEYNFNLVFSALLIVYLVLGTFFQKRLSMYFFKLAMAGKTKTIKFINIALFLVSLPLFYFFWLECILVPMLYAPVVVYQFKKSVKYVNERMIEEITAAAVEAQAAR